MDRPMTSVVTLADSHVHLDRYPPAELRAMLRRAAEVGVVAVLTVGTDAASSRAAVRLAGLHRGVWAAVGTHPLRVPALADPAAELRALARAAARPGVVAIGEVGLDHSADRPADALARQRSFFEGCLDLAAAADLPLVLHVVGAHDVALDLLAARAPVRAVVHYFVGDAELAARYLELGCSISVGKPVTRPTEAAPRQALAAIPLDRLLLETDTYPLPGRTTEPRDVIAVCEAVAEIRGVTPAEVAVQTMDNFRRLFRTVGTVR